MKTISILLVFLLSFNCFADPKYIDKGTPAPTNGFLFSVPKTKAVRKALIEKDQLTIFNKALQEDLKVKETVIVNQKEQVKILSKQNEKLAKQIDNDHTMSNFERSVWFILGITASGLAVYGAKQLAR